MPVFVKKIYQNIFNWSVAIGWLLMIFYLSSRPSFPVELTPSTYNIISSLTHVLLYAILAWLLVRALRTSGCKLKRALIYAFLIAIVYGAGDEWHQSFAPGREMSLSDWLIDGLSALIVIYYYSWKNKFTLK